MTTTELVRKIEAYCRTHEIAETTFGRMAVNDGKLIARLRDGASITLATADKIEKALAAPPIATEAAE